jgi:SAM-dependent methyltransferase
MRDRLIALVVNTSSTIESEIDFLRGEFPEVQERTLRIFSGTSRIGIFPPDRSVVGSMYYINARRLFNRVLVGRNMRVFRSQWGDALFAYLNDLLADDGDIVIPCTEGSAEGRTSGFYAYSDLQDLFAQPGLYLKNLAMGVFKRRTDMPRASSTLNWLVDHYGAIVHEDILLRARPDVMDVQRLDDMYLQCFKDQGEALVQRPRDVVGVLNPHDDSWFVEERDETEKGKSYPAAFGRALKSVTYLFGGVKYKAPIIKNIVKNAAPAKPPGGKCLDLGGGYGTLTAELLLDKDLQFTKGIVCDFNKVFATQAGNLYRAHLNELRGRYFYASSRIEEFAFDERYRLITMLSSLLYIPRAHHAEVIEKCWKCLEPGGVLVIFELTKSDPRNPDYHKQFTAQEIDELLGRHAPVRRFSRSSLFAIANAAAGDNAMFRAIVKPE